LVVRRRSRHPALFPRFGTDLLIEAGGFGVRFEVHLLLKAEAIVAVGEKSRGDVAGSR
jgi:hypothetical protein